MSTFLVLLASTSVGGCLPDKIIPLLQWLVDNYNLIMNPRDARGIPIVVLSDEPVEHEYHTDVSWLRSAAYFADPNLQPKRKIPKLPDEEEEEEEITDEGLFVTLINFLSHHRCIH